MIVIACIVAAVVLADDPGSSPTLGATPPEGATVLFDGVDWSGWARRDGAPSNWDVQAAGSVQVRPEDGNAISRVEFRDCQLHIEFLCPEMPNASGQGRANSGVYLHGRYEVQVLDSFGLETLVNGCGAIYGQHASLTNASRPPGTWQTYDIFFRGPRFDDEGTVTEKPRITVLHNGVLIHNNVDVHGPTTAAMAEDMVETGPLMLQAHGNSVRYRNIWISNFE